MAKLLRALQLEMLTIAMERQEGTMVSTREGVCSKRSKMAFLVKVTVTVAAVVTVKAMMRSVEGRRTKRWIGSNQKKALKWEGIHTFRDVDEIKRGESIEPEIEKAIWESEVSIIVLSEDYASSTWCLDELAMIMERRKTVGHVVLPVFYDVNSSDVLEQSGSFAEAFVGHEECLKDELDRVEFWREATNLGGMVMGDR
ncbi:hypothetical protein JCGZ_20183 [Jatropha curcas]|uniref:TIR domain-containing protein n=1 Tax=Jatropha curcas TaxID=180498 RepID=A0A067K6C1_JATCU|nr:hypothetical protein JCGZ_20183 [Jatropha curcas]